MEKSDTIDVPVAAPAPTEESRALAAQREAALEKALAAVGGAITAPMIASAFADAEQKKSNFQVAAVRLGIMLEAKFLAVSAARAAGEDVQGFGAFCAEAFGDKSVRTLRSYRWLAKRFLSAAVTPLTSLTARSPLVVEAAGIESAETALVALAENNPRAGALDARIEKFIAGRSLRELATDLSSAEKSAAREEFYEQASVELAEESEAESASAFADELKDLPPDMSVLGAAIRSPILDAPIEPADVLPFAEIFRDVDAQAEDAIGFLIAKKEEVSPRVLAANMRTLAELFEAKAKKAMSLARSAERAKEDPAASVAAEGEA